MSKRSKDMNTYKRISAKEAKEILKNNNCLLLDIRDYHDYEESHDPQSFHLSSDNLRLFIKTTHKATPLLVLCYHGNSSQQIAEYLIENDFLEVYSIDGGYEAWLKISC